MVGGSLMSKQKHVQHVKDIKSDRNFKIVNYTFLTIAMAVVLYPLIYVLSASISDPTAVNSGKMWLWPKDINFEGYKEIFNQDRKSIRLNSSHVSISYAV